MESHAKPRRRSRLAVQKPAGAELVEKRSEHGAFATRSLGPLPLQAKLGYGLGAFVDGITSNALNFFLMFYATVVCGLGGTRAGLALSAGLVVDAIVDPMIGSLSDRCKSSLGRRLPFMIAGLPIAGAALFLIFSIPTGLEENARFSLLLLLSVVLRSSISLFNLPYLAFGAEISDDYAERSSLAAWRWGLGMLGGLIMIGLGFGVFLNGQGGTTNRAAYPPFALSIAMIMVLVASGSLYAVWRLRARLHELADHDATSVFAGLKAVAGDATFRTLFGSTILLFVGEGVTFTLSLHCNGYFWRLTPSEIQLVSVALLGGLLVGAPVIAPLAKRLEKKSLLIANLAMLVLTQSAPIGLRLLDLLPFHGMTLAPFLAANAVLTGLSISGAVIATSSMLADVADQHELSTGRRREGLLFAGWSFASKAAGGLGALFAGIALDGIGFPSGTAIRPDKLAPATLSGLGIVSGPAAAVFCLFGIFVLSRYRLTRQTHMRIMTALGRGNATS